MNGLAGRFASMYAWLMRLYPAHYQNEFAGERQEVFALALEETAAKGNWALIGLMLCELRDFPVSAVRAKMREWEATMETLEKELGEDRLSWTGLLLGVWPFIFLGPVMAAAPYLPQDAAQFFRYDSPVWIAVVVLSVILGVILGGRKGFPRWVYPYLVILFFAIATPLLAQLSLLLDAIQLNRWISLALLLAVIPGLGAVMVFLMSRFPSTRKIIRDIRSDWTRLSFGMVIYLSFGTSFYGGDHPPAFGPVVWLPSLIVACGALVYLFCRNRIQRSVALFATLFLSILTKFIFPNDDVWAVLPVFLVVLLIFLPALVELLPRPNRSQIAEK